MKKITTVILSALMLFSLTACEKRELTYAESPDKTEARRGVVEDGLYKGDFTELEFRIPEGWECLTDEELLKITGDAPGLTYDMMCQNNQTGSVVAVLYEDLLKSAGTNRITEEEYIKSVSENLYSMGLSVSDEEDITLGGNGFLMLRAHGEGEGITVEQCSLVRKHAGYMISVIVTASNGDDADALLNYFS